MQIINRTKERIIADSFEECKTFWEQTRGLMFRKEVVPLLFTFPKPQTVRLHSWFCPDAIDLIFLDDSWEVVEMRSEWDKFSSYESNKPALFLLELPAGTIAQSRTEVGDIVHIVK